MEKPTLHVVPHSHWDREWYMSFEQHRMRLVELFDTLIDLMEKDSGYTYYHMDGQYIAVEDYLEIRPEMKDRLKALISANRIQIGPWYVLQDEYLTSGEANVRNMLYGLQMCRAMGGEPVMTGYFPDAFGNIGQAPQILRGFGIDNAAFGRGIGAILEDNKVDPNATSYPSEIKWRSPDGSEVIGILFSPWYNNAMELPSNPDVLHERLEGLMRGLKGAGATPHWLALNGCDHQPVQTDLHQVIDTANQLFPEVEVKQSNFKDYVAAIRPYADRFSYIEGEINGQRTGGQVPLVDTASAHVPLKQKNHRGQNALECLAEPLSVMASVSESRDYPRDQLLYAWKKLMQNHPHDSICSCSCDDVTREMDIRFDKSYQVARYQSDEALRVMTQRIRTAQADGEDRYLVVFHTESGKTTDCVTATVDFSENSGVEALTVYDGDRELPTACKSLGKVFTYELPKDRFRQPAWVDRFEVTFPLTMEGVGYRTLSIKAEKPKAVTAVRALERGAENEFLTFVVENNGSLTVTDRRSGEVYHNIGVMEDCADMGDLYNFRPGDGDVPLTTEQDVARCYLVSQSPCHVTVAVENHMEIPKCRNNSLRSEATVSTVMTTKYTLRTGVARIDCETEFENRCEDHRVRVLFRPEIQADTVMAEGQFDVVDREIVPYPTWENPCYCQRMQAFFALSDGKRGLLIATRGLNEYEILRDGQNTMALTLLRCVGQIGDWGYFPTPNGQCKGKQTLSYSIVPFEEKNRADAYRLGYAFHGEPYAAKWTKAHTGDMAPAHTYFAACGDFMAFCALKMAEDRNSMILRLYNADRNETALSIRVGEGHKVYAVDLAENRGEQISGTEITVPKKKIVSLEII